MSGTDDRDKPPVTDGDDGIDRDNNARPGPLVDRDDDDIFAADLPPREPAFLQEREYPAVPDWDDEGSDPGSLPDWEAPSADNDDLNRLAARDLEEPGDDPYPSPPDDPHLPTDTRPGTGTATLTENRDDRDSTSEDAFDKQNELDEDSVPDDSAPDDNVPYNSAPYDEPLRNDPLPGEPQPYDAKTAEPYPDDHQNDWQDDDSLNSEDDSWSDESTPAAADVSPLYTTATAAGHGLTADEPSADSGHRGWPMAMLAVAALAVVLLAVGGYGVLSERSALEGEIRQLQAQLATTVSPEEARASRDALQASEQAAEQEKITLEGEMRALQSENAELQTTLRDLEARLAQREADVETAMTEARQAAAAAARSRPAAASGGDWFVNFGSYGRVADAKRWADRLRVDSGNVVVQDAQAQGGTIHRVRIVGLADKSTADRVARKLESDHKLPKLWVGKD